MFVSLKRQHAKTEEQKEFFYKVRKEGNLIHQHLNRKYEKLLKSVFGGDLLETFGYLRLSDGMNFDEIMDKYKVANKKGKKTPVKVAKEENQEER